MGLFAPAWTTDNPKKLDKAIAAVGKINDSNQLYEIATTAPINEVRKAAIGRITDQAMLAKIVEQSESFSAANAALERLSDPAQLKQIALKGHTECSGSDLFEKITDQTTLYEIATRSDDLNMRLRAIDGLDDADTLLSLMAGAPSAKEREKAREQVEELYIDHCGIGGLFAKHKDDELTDEQFRRYIDALIAETDPQFTPYLPDRASDDDLRRIYRNAGRKQLREKAFRDLMFKAPAEELPALYREAKGERWGDAQKSIEARVDNKESDKPELLAAFVRDADCGCNMASRCLRLLFAPKLDGVDGIEGLRDEAVDAALENIPAYTAGDSYHTLEYCLDHIAAAITPEARAKHGIGYSRDEFKAEDAFGSYDAASVTITYQGKTYHC